MAFQRAQRRKVYLKLAITGPSGSGKTYSALRLALGLGQKVALLDSENESANIYADLGDFDTDTICAPFTPQKYIEAIRAAELGGYDVLIIDSLSHAWAMSGGILDQKAAKDRRGGNSFTNWQDMTPLQNDFLATILQSKLDIIATMRSKQEYVIETTDKGKQAPRKVGLAPIQRDGIEYEFTTVFDVDQGHMASVSKDRTGLFTDEISMITEAHGLRLKSWRDAAIGDLQVAKSTVNFAPVALPVQSPAEVTADEIIKEIVRLRPLAFPDDPDTWPTYKLRLREHHGIEKLKGAHPGKLQDVLGDIRILAEKNNPQPLVNDDPFANMEVDMFGGGATHAQ